MNDAMHPPLSSGASAANGEPPERDVALLIDWENLKIGLQRRFNVGPNISSLTDAARDYGRLVVARAYADWTRALLRVDAPNLYRAGIEPIYIPSWHPAQDAPLKNSADIRLAVDAVDLCGQLPHIATYVLATGDGDLIHALNFLRLRGRRVVIIGVGQSMNALLSAAADAVLVYERDIDSLAVGAPVPAVSKAIANVPAIERTFGWIVAALRDYADDEPFPFTDLGDRLRQRHGMNVRAWYNIPFKDLMRLAERAGHVRLSTIGGVDYAALAGEPAPQLSPVATVEAADATAFANDAGLQINSLSDDEQRTLLAYLRQLQRSSAYLTFKYIVDKLVYDSVLPRLSREQVGQIVNHLSAQGMLAPADATSAAPESGGSSAVPRLMLDLRHQRVREILGDAVDATVEATVDPFDALLPSLEAARETAGVAYINAVQHELESRLGCRLLALGYARPLLFFRDAAARGLIRLAEPGTGQIVILRPDEPDPPPAALGEPALPKLGDVWLPETLRVLAAIEEQTDGREPPITHSGKIHALRLTLAAHGGPMLRSAKPTGCSGANSANSAWSRRFPSRSSISTPARAG
ncbi:MAG TPA: NYN domain-containing protein [Thermomicrobiales bacterium]|nr:NYN domain-containing protein [Thermomicrobiales bacterium]